MKKWMQNKNFAAWLIVLTIIMFAATAFAAALTADRATPERSGQLVGLVQGSNVIYAGSMVAVNASGVAVPASDATGLKVIGRAQSYSDNQTTALYSATKVVTIKRGVFRWANGGSFTAASIGNLAYVSDDQTVTTAASATYDIVAGIIVDYDAATTDVWVDTYAVGGQGALSVTTLATSGNASVGGTLAVTSTITGSSTISGTGYKLSGVSGFTGNITNAIGTVTNVQTYVTGLLTTNVVTN